MITAPKQDREYADRKIDCQEAMEPGFQPIVDCMLEAGWSRGEIKRSSDAEFSAFKRNPQSVFYQAVCLPIGPL
jgi:hypothetical protein